MWDMIVINPKTHETVEAYNPTDDYTNSTLEVRECMMVYHNYITAVNLVPQQRALVFDALKKFHFVRAWRYLKNMRQSMRDRNTCAAQVFTAMKQLKNACSDEPYTAIRATWD